MAENQNEVAAATTQANVQAAPPAPPPAPAPKSKPKPEKVRIQLCGAGSCNFNGLIFKSGEVREFEADKAEEFLRSGLFRKL